MKPNNLLPRGNSFLVGKSKYWIVMICICLPIFTVVSFSSDWYTLPGFVMYLVFVISPILVLFRSVFWVGVVGGAKIELRFLLWRSKYLIEDIENIEVRDIPFLYLMILKFNGVKGVPWVFVPVGIPALDKEARQAYENSMKDNFASVGVVLL